MAMPRKPTPVKYCECCGKKLERKVWENGKLESLLHFNRRKYCDKKCMAIAFDAKESRTNEWSTAHYHSRKAIPHGPCSICGKLDARDVHHKDGNYLNNSIDNLERVCRSCHNKIHRGGKVCSICGRPHKAFGLRDMHYQRLKKWGDPLIVKVNQHTDVVEQKEPLKNAGHRTRKCDE